MRIRIKTYWKQNGVHPYDNTGEKVKQNRTSWKGTSQDKEKDVEEKELHQRGEGQSGQKEKKEDEEKNEWLRKEDRKRERTLR